MKVTKTSCVKEFLQANPKATTTEIQDSVVKKMGSSVDPATISEVRKQMGIRVQYNKRKVPAVEISTEGLTKDMTLVQIVKEGFKRNPSATNEEFRQLCSKIKGYLLGPLNGTMLKKIRGNTVSRPPRVNPTVSRPPRVNRKGKLYMTVWSHPTNGVSKQSKEILSSFIEELNVTGRTKFELVERLNPDTLEVRELA